MRLTFKYGKFSNLDTFLIESQTYEDFWSITPFRANKTKSILEGIFWAYNKISVGSKPITLNLKL